jgi:hypothetical protein
MSSKIFTSKFRVFQTPLKASDMSKDEMVIATDAIDGLLFTYMHDGKETIYDITECPEGSAPIYFPPYEDISNSK